MSTNFDPHTSTTATETNASVATSTTTATTESTAAVGLRSRTFYGPKFQPLPVRAAEVADYESFDSILVAPNALENLSRFSRAALIEEPLDFVATFLPASIPAASGQLDIPAQIALFGQHMQRFSPGGDTHLNVDGEKWAALVNAYDTALATGSAADRIAFSGLLADMHDQAKTMVRQDLLPDFRNEMRPILQRAV